MTLHLLIWLGTEPGATAACLALWLTYSAHALVWTGVIALLVRRKSLSSWTRHLSWKAALFGPLATTLLSAALPSSPERVRDVSVVSLAGTFGSTDGAPAGESTATGEASVSRWPLLAAFGAGTLLLGLFRFTTSSLLVRRTLRARRRVDDTRLLRSLERMRLRSGFAPVLLTESARIGSPLIVGTSEICVPAKTLAALGDAELDAVFAHELAHLERRDGLWFPVVGLVQSVLWIHPTNHWASAGFRETAELACDERAVELTGDPLGLARALVHVAASMRFTEQRPLVPAMGPRSASALRQRVQRLTQDGPQFQPRSRGRLWVAASAAAVVVATAGLCVRVARARPSEPAPTEAAAPVDAAALGERMAELMRRERETETELETVSSLLDAHVEGTATSIRVLELEQELRHLRAAMAWTEERAVGEAANRAAPRPGAP